MIVRVEIPGEPVAQGRPKAFFNKHTGRAGVYEPAKSRNWKATAQEHMRLAMAGRDAIAGPVELHVTAVFTLAKSHWRKSHRVPRAWKPGRPDADNIVKCVSDASNGVVVLDDSQVCRVIVEKIAGAQGEAPKVIVWFRELPNYVADAMLQFKEKPIDEPHGSDAVYLARLAPRSRRVQGQAIAVLAAVSNRDQRVEDAAGLALLALLSRAFKDETTDSDKLRAIVAQSFDIAEIFVDEADRRSKEK